MNTNEVILHGESTVFPANIPQNANKKTVKRDAFVIVASSETTGNHHVVDAPEGVDFYETETGVLFMDSKVDTQIRCIHADRHDAITIPPGTYEFGSQQEYDPFAARMQSVRD